MDGPWDNWVVNKVNNKDNYYYYYNMCYSTVLIWWADSIVSTAIRLYSNQSSGYTVVNHAKRESGAEQNYSIIK